MDFSNAQRVFKLAGELIRKPQFVSPYLSGNLFSRRRSPLSQNLPWWSFAAIQAADRLFPGKRIFEWGSGGSTLRYAQMGCEIIAIEHDPLWLDAL